MDLLPLLACLAPCLNSTTLRRLACVVAALLAMTGRVTLLGLSRWTEEGGSYRTVQRFFNTGIPWEKARWLLIRRHLRQLPGVVLVGGDEVVTPKAGRHTHGLGRFFSSVYGRPVPSVCHLGVSLTPVSERTSYPVMALPVKAPEKASATPPPEPTPRRSRGRPKGSRNRVRRDVELTAPQKFLREALRSLLALVGTELTLAYLVYDGALGHNAGVQLTRQCGLHLISKLRHDSALYLPHDGPYSGRGPRRKYGPRLDYDQLPGHCLRDSTVEDGIRTDTYHVTARHRKFADPLNVVILVKTNLKTSRSARVLLFSSDPALAWNDLVDYDSLRFQIEFNFRDAKQFWGLDDFMSIQERPATNAANLALFMVNVSHLLRQQPEYAGMSVLDLKAWFRAGKYVRETLKWLPQIPESISIDPIVRQVASLGRVNMPETVA